MQELYFEIRKEDAEDEMVHRAYLPAYIYTNPEAREMYLEYLDEQEISWDTIKVIRKGLPFGECTDELIAIIQRRPWGA